MGSQGLQHLCPVGGWADQKHREREGWSWEGFLGEAPACWEVSPDKEQPPGLRLRKGMGFCSEETQSNLLLPLPRRRPDPSNVPVPVGFMGCSVR